MQTDLNSFFSFLAERKNSENDLSDITYSMCQTNGNFKRFFLKFCFDEEVDTNDLSREYAQNDSRPDFFFHDRKNQERLIEVKLYDRNQHFAQYKKEFPDAKYSFIANYQHEKVDGWDPIQKSV